MSFARQYKEPGLQKHIFNPDTQSVTLNGTEFFCTFDRDGHLSHESKYAIAKAEGEHFRFVNGYTVGVGVRVVCSCRYCEQKFLGKPRSFFCDSDFCVRQHFQRRQNRSRKFASIGKVEMIRKYQKCKQCGGAMEKAKRRSCKFCSNACRQAAHRNGKEQREKLPCK